MNKAKVVKNNKNTDEFIDKANGFIGDRIRDMNMKHRYFKLKEKVKSGKKDEKVCMTKKAFKKEHKNLLKVLKKKDPKKLDAEAKEQKEEMKKYGMQESIKTTGLKAVKLRKWDGVNDRPWVQDEDSAKHRAFGANVVNAKGKKGDKQYARVRRVRNDDRPENRDWNTNARFRKEQEKARGMKKTKESGGVLRAVKLVIRESNLEEKTAGEVEMQANALKAKIKNSSMPMHKKWNKLTKVASATMSSKKKATDEKRTSSAKAFKMLSDKLLKRKA